MEASGEEQRGSGTAPVVVVVFLIHHWRKRSCCLLVKGNDGGSFCSSGHFKMTSQVVHKVSKGLVYYGGFIFYGREGIVPRTIAAFA